MGAIAKKLSRRKTKLIFDIRGFFPEEYTDAGSWKKNGLIYRTVKVIEKWLLKEADGFVVLTEKAREILFPESKETGFDMAGRPVEVIPCCVDLSRFEAASEESKREIRSQYNLEDRFVITYIGSFGSWYLADEMADLLSASRQQDDKTFALILTQSAPEIMTEKLTARGFTKNDFLVKKASHNEIPRFLSASDAALSFIKPCYSKLSSSPTKIAEYLASGTPVIANSGVGDIEEQIESDGVGVIIENFNQESYLEALQKIKVMGNGNLGEKCKISAVNRFDLERIGGEKYRRLYRSLLQK
jgi:glycosyltransferase involved in cell wall biosynthesis